MDIPHTKSGVFPSDTLCCPAATTHFSKYDAGFTLYLFALGIDDALLDRGYTQP